MSRNKYRTKRISGRLFYYSKDGSWLRALPEGYTLKLAPEPAVGKKRRKWKAEVIMHAIITETIFACVEATPALAAEKAMEFYNGTGSKSSMTTEQVEV